MILRKFIEYRLRKGDAIIVDGVGIGLLTKETKNYWYYFYQNTSCKVRKDKVWHYIDTGKIKVEYGSSMKRRRKRKTNRTLDLHGCRMENLEENVKSFLNFVDLPCKIITGNSSRMKASVKSIVNDYGWECWEESAQNQGTLIVVENKKGEIT